MCTVSWYREPSGYSLFFNRDERKTRRTATPPGIKQKAGVEYLSPVDPESGGTWLLVNAYGLSIGLLNYYPGLKYVDAERAVSRGLLVDSLADCEKIEILETRLNQCVMSSYNPFILIALQKGKPSLYAKWDGEKLNMSHDADRRLPITSSSFNTEAVIKERSALFNSYRKSEGNDGKGWFEHYHRSFTSQRGAYSVCMLRDDAETVSLSHITMSDAKIRYVYYPKIIGKAEFHEPFEATLVPVNSLSVS